MFSIVQDLFQKLLNFFWDLLFFYLSWFLNELILDISDFRYLFDSMNIAFYRKTLPTTISEVWNEENFLPM